jgi:hypothetical protein
MTSRLGTGKTKFFLKVMSAAYIFIFLYKAKSCEQYFIFDLDALVNSVDDSQK